MGILWRRKGASVYRNSGSRELDASAYRSASMHLLSRERIKPMGADSAARDWYMCADEHACLVRSNSVKLLPYCMYVSFKCMASYSSARNSHARMRHACSSAHMN